MGLSDDDVDAVLEHMNADHLDASLAIVRAHGYPAATAAEMTGVDDDGGTWHVTDGAAGAEASLRVTWPGGPVTGPDGVRREVVGLVRAARWVSPGPVDRPSDENGPSRGSGDG